MLLLGVFFTAVHSTTLLDFGFNHDQLYNGFVWHFANRSYAHGFLNFLMFFILIGSAISVSIFELMLISVFAYFLGFNDPLPFYGSSGIAYLMLGKAITRERVMSAYRWLSLEIHIPYLLIIMFVIHQLLTSASLTISIEFLHLYSFVIGAALSTSSLYRQDTFSNLNTETRAQDGKCRSTSTEIRT